MKSKINKVFKELRKIGYIAKQNYMCCQSCGWAEIESEYENTDKVVFYHEQDSDTLRDSGELYICWSGDGSEICNVIQSQGLVYEWDGLDTTRILIKEV